MVRDFVLLMRLLLCGGGGMEYPDKLRTALAEHSDTYATAALSVAAVAWMTCLRRAGVQRTKSCAPEFIQHLFTVPLLAKPTMLLATAFWTDEAMNGIGTWMWIFACTYESYEAGHSHGCLAEPKTFSRAAPSQNWESNVLRSRTTSPIFVVGRTSLANSMTHNSCTSALTKQLNCLEGFCRRAKLLCSTIRRKQQFPDTAWRTAVEKSSLDCCRLLIRLYYTERGSTLHVFGGLVTAVSKSFCADCDLPSIESLRNAHASPTAACKVRGEEELIRNFKRGALSRRQVPARIDLQPVSNSCRHDL
jgi:hypothetical protein